MLIDDPEMEKAVVLLFVRFSDSTPLPRGRDMRYGLGEVVNNEKKTERSFSLIFTTAFSNCHESCSNKKKDSNPKLWV